MRKSGSCLYWCDVSRIVCRSVARRIWNVPSDATTIWLVAHNKPAKDRVRVTRKWTWCVDGVETNLTIAAIRYVLQALAKTTTRTIYVELWYE